MTVQTEKTTAYKLASIISGLFSPLILPTYGMLIAMWLTPLSLLALGVRIWATVGIFCITTLIPATILAIMFRKGKISDLSVSNRKQRLIPFISVIICFCAAATFLYSLSAPAWLVLFYIGAGCSAFISMIINFRWKISAHAAGIAGLTAAVFWLGQHGHLICPPLPCISAFIIIAGLVSWARLYLRQHDIWQVFAGCVLSFTIMYTILNF
ncbi:MAG: hypothetical protein J1F05_07865 [Muribaculaceae bacterium]|nr:hypothetical protein [Muribaculaceae bacterium]